MVDKRITELPSLGVALTSAAVAAIAQGGTTYKVPISSIVGGSNAQVQYNNNGVFGGAAGITVVNSGNSLAFSGTPSTSGVVRVGNNPSTVIGYRGYNAANRSALQIVGDGSTFDDILVGDDDATGGNSALYLRSKGFTRINQSGNPWFTFDRVGSGNEPRITLEASASSPGAWLDYASSASATDTTRRTFTISGQRKSGNTSTVGGTVALLGGDATGAGGSHTGGWAKLAGGSATGASGTRVGGDVSIYGGTGTTRYGNVFIGTDYDPATWNWQSMGRGIAVQDATAEPTADATSAFFHWSNSGRPKWRFNSTTLRFDGTATTASAGAQTLPANPVGFLTVELNGTTRKIPYYAN